MTADHQPAIRWAGVSKHYGGTAALEDFSLEIPAGSIVALLGPSGSGKTTALRMVAGFERPDQGTVEIGGEVVAGSDVLVPPEQRSVGMVFQDYALFPHLTIAGNVGYGVPASDRRHRTAEVLGLVGLTAAADRHPHELSGGEQQRVALARALAPEPDVILLDEPFSNLDARRRDRVRREVRTILVEARSTAIFVTHDQEEALAMSDTVAVTRDGRIVQVAAPGELYRRPTDCWVARFLGEAEFVDGTASTGKVETPLGTFADGSRLEGPVEVMIRPESVEILAGGSGATVVDREFYGHDQLVTVQLAEGRTLLSRVGPSPAFEPGDTVGIRIREVVVFSGSGHDHG